MFYVPDGIGLGHLKRETLVAEALAKRIKGVSITIVTANRIATKVLEGHNFRLILVGEPPPWKRESISSTKKRFYNDLRGAVSDIDPGVFIVDYLAWGYFGEILPVLLEPGKIKVLVLPYPLTGSRMIIDRILPLYDMLIVGDRKESFEMGLPKQMEKRTHYVGPLVRSIGKELPKKSENFRQVIVTAGGGNGTGTGFDLCRNVLQALELVSPHICGLKTILVAGPMMPKEEYEKLKKLADSQERTTVVDFLPDLPIHIASSDLVISTAGSTLFEIAQTDTPSIVWVSPKRPSNDQKRRAKPFQELGMARVMDKINPGNLADEILSALLNKDAKQKQNLARCGFISGESIEEAARLICKLYDRKRISLQEGR